MRPTETRFATSYLILGYLMENKGALIRMCNSNNSECNIVFNIGLIHGGQRSLIGMFTVHQGKQI